jgi:hypothetical protein
MVGACQTLLDGSVLQNVIQLTVYGKLTSKQALSKWNLTDSLMLTASDDSSHFTEAVSGAPL